MNPNEQYWNNFYSNDNELPLAPSDFAVFFLDFYKPLPKKNLIKKFLVLAVATEEMLIFFRHRALKLRA